MYVVFNSREAAENAFRHMAGVHVPIRDTNNLGMSGLKEEESAARPQTFILLCSLWKTIQKPGVVNPIANTPERVDADYDACCRLLTALERYWVRVGEKVDVQGVKSAWQTVLEEVKAKCEWLTKRELVDMMVYYLRRVYGYEYWTFQYLAEYGVCYHVREWRRSDP